MFQTSEEYVYDIYKKSYNPGMKIDCLPVRDK